MYYFFFFERSFKPLLKNLLTHCYFLWVFNTSVSLLFSKLESFLFCQQHITELVCTHFRVGSQTANCCIQQRLWAVTNNHMCHTSPAKEIYSETKNWKLLNPNCKHTFYVKCISVLTSSSPFLVLNMNCIIELFCHHKKKIKNQSDVVMVQKVIQFWGDLEGTEIQIRSQWGFYFENNTKLTRGRKEEFYQQIQKIAWAP